MYKNFWILLFTVITHLSYSQNFDLQGHRGARGLLPENSIPGFIKAIDLGVTTIEMDVVISGDGKVVVSHEPWINSDICLGPQGKAIEKNLAKELNIYKMSYQQIQSFDCGSIGNPRFSGQQKVAATKPLLEYAIAEIEKHIKANGKFPVRYNIEIKCRESTDGEYHPEPGEFSRIVYEQIEASLPWDRIVIQSFDMRVLQYWNQNYDHVTLAYLVENIKSIENNLETLGFNPAIYSPYYKLIKKVHIDYLHNKGIKLIPWTVNDTEDMKRLEEWGVDGLITDYPDKAVDLGMGVKQGDYK